MKRISIATALVFVATLAISVFAAEHANFAGNWTLDASKSQGGMGGGQQGGEVTMTVTVEGDVIKTATTAPGRDGTPRTRNQEINTDGKSHEVQGGGGGMGGGPSTVTATWSADGKTLKVETDRAFTNQQGEAMKIHSVATWSLSADGKVLTIESSTEGGPRGPSKSTQVYNKK